jgi:hypothetical protein
MRWQKVGRNCKSINACIVIKSRRMRWARYVAEMGLKWARRLN